MINLSNLDMSMIQSNAGQPWCEPWGSLQWSKWAWTFHPKSSAWTSSSISNLKRWGTGEPISLSPALQPLLSWDFYPPSGTRCLTSYSPKRRRQQRASEVRPTPVLVTVGLPPPISPIYSFAFLSITGLLAPDCKWFYRGCWRPNVTTDAASTESAEGLLTRVFQNGFSSKTKSRWK